MEQRQRAPSEQAGSDNLDRAVKKYRHGFVLKPDDDRPWQRRRRGRGQQSVRIAKVEDQLHTTIGRDVLPVLGRISPLMDPEALDGIRGDLVRVVLVVFHGSSLGLRSYLLRNLPPNYQARQPAYNSVTPRQTGMAAQVRWSAGSARNTQLLNDSVVRGQPAPAHRATAVADAPLQELRPVRDRGQRSVPSGNSRHRAPV